MVKLSTNLLLLSSIFFLAFTFGFQSCSPQAKAKVYSPSKNILIEFETDENGIPHYLVKYHDESIIERSALGFDFRDTEDMLDGFIINSVSHTSRDENWQLPWGEKIEVRDWHNEMMVTLVDTSGRILLLYFRAYDDGMAYRYEIPKISEKDELIILDERSEFTFSGDHNCWWIPGDWDIYEHLYNETKLTEIDAISKRDHPNLAQTYIPYNAVNTPVTMETSSGTFISIHEAALTDYPGMTLLVDSSSYKLTSELVGSDRKGYKAKVKLPFKSPWRSIQLAKDAGKLIESDLILNLNEPNKLEDIDWFTPNKYVGIWWEMHLGKSSWRIDAENHGATTENAKKYIDFAAANDIGAVLVEGWNTGWEVYLTEDEREGQFDFVTPYPDYDINEVVAYARDKNVEIIMHHETSAAPRTYEHQLDTAFSLMEDLGMHTVKTGYVGKLIPKGEYHHGQWMVKHYRKVLETAAKYKVAVNAHEPIKATGIRRTYPNAISREGLRGQEFNAWATDGGNPPSHIPTIAFTRMLAGPIDFTPGVFELGLETKDDNQINTTLAHQLALYVVLYSPVQMACDLPENYEGKAAFQFIRDVGVDWKQSKVLHARIGDYVCIAREEKNSGNWFIGAVTNEQARVLDLDFDFLEAQQDYTAIIYKDGENASWKGIQDAIIIDTVLVNQQSNLKINIAEGGGFAISLFKN